MKKRSELLDLVKGIAIILMIFGHSMQFGTGEFWGGERTYWDNTVLKVIYSFHMPVFAGISGYLFYFSVKSKGIVKATLQRYKKLFPIIIGWVPIMLIAGKLLGKNEIKITSAIWLFFTDYWFLWTIVISSTLICIIMSNEKIYIKVLITIVVQFLLLISSDYSWISAHKFMFVCYWIGYIVAEYNLISENKYSKKVLLFSIVLWLLLLLFYTRDSYIYTTGYSLFGENALVWYKQLGIDVYRIIIGLFGSVSVVGIMYFISKKTKLQMDWLAWCGKNSLGIYVISGFLSSYVVEPLFSIHVSSYLSMYLLSIIETIVILIVCVVLIKLIKKNKILTGILIG